MLLHSLIYGPPTGGREGGLKVISLFVVELHFDVKFICRSTSVGFSNDGKGVVGDGSLHVAIALCNCRALDNGHGYGRPWKIRTCPCYGRLVLLVICNVSTDPSAESACTCMAKYWHLD